MTNEIVAAAALPIDVHTPTADSKTSLSGKTTITTPPSTALLAVRPKRANRCGGRFAKLNSTTATTTNCYNSYERDTAHRPTLSTAITATDE